MSHKTVLEINLSYQINYQRFLYLYENVGSATERSSSVNSFDGISIISS
jgi:hypothetical protein